MDDLDSLSSLGPSFLISGIEVGPDGRPRPPLLTPWDWQAVLPHWPLQTCYLPCFSSWSQICLVCPTVKWQFFHSSVRSDPGVPSEHTAPWAPGEPLEESARNFHQGLTQAPALWDGFENTHLCGRTE